MALGAQRSSILWLVIRAIFIMEFMGPAIGLPLALAGSRYVESFLYGIEPHDPFAMIVSVGVLLAAGLAAGFVPAFRASRIDPFLAIRYE